VIRNAGYSGYGPRAARSGDALPVGTADRLDRWRARALQHLRATAFHEASHITAGFFNGLPVGRFAGATIVPGCGVWGLARLGPFPGERALAGLRAASAAGLPGDSRARRKFEGFVVAVMAGSLGETRAVVEGLAPREALPSSDLERHLQWRERVFERMAAAEAALEAGEVPGLPNDEQIVAELLSAACASEAEKRSYLWWLRDRAESLVKSDPFWISTRALADALLEREVIDGAECVRISRDALAAGDMREAPWLARHVRNGHFEHVCRIWTIP
jgi:hypothetical protein